MRRGEECRRHVGERAEKCPWCVHGRKGWDEVDEDAAVEPVDKQTALDAARAALRSTSSEETSDA
jgi:hypothetical protein